MFPCCELWCPKVGKQGNSSRNTPSQKKPHWPQVCDIQTEPESVLPWLKKHSDLEEFSNSSKDGSYHLAQQFHSEVYAQENWEHTLTQKLVTNSSIICDNQERGNNPTPINLWLNQQSVVQWCSGVAFSHKNEQGMDTLLQHAWTLKTSG